MLHSLGDSRVPHCLLSTADISQVDGKLVVSMYSDHSQRRPSPPPSAHAALGPNVLFIGSPLHFTSFVSSSSLEQWRHKEIIFATAGVFTKSFVIGSMTLPIAAVADLTKLLAMLPSLCTTTVRIQDNVALRPVAVALA